MTADISSPDLALGGLLVLICVIILLIVLSAFFSGSETALTAASDARMHSLSRKGSRNAGIILRLRQKRESLISALLIGNNLVNVTATSLATSTAIALLGETGIAVATIGMTLLLVLFAEVLPKTYAFNNADRVALAFAKPVRWLVLVLTPLTLSLRWLTDMLIHKPAKGAEVSDDDDDDELRGIIEMQAQKVSGGEHTDAERRERSAMLSSVLDLEQVTVDEIMTHRAAVQMIDASNPPDQTLRQLLESPFTRHPVFSGKPENIVGVLHVKALLRAVTRAGDSAAALPDIIQIAADPYFIPETTLLIDQLQAFRSRREHFAVVVDEYGDFRGIVTLEDILEEIVGEIDDEHDLQITGLSAQPDGSWIADGSVTIRDLNRALGWNLPDDDAVTIAGLVLNEARIIPVPGQEFRFHDVRFRILRRDRNTLSRIRLWRENINS